MSTKPVDRARRVVGVQRGEDQVPGQGRPDRDLRGLAVADLADHHHVGVLPQDRPQPVREAQPPLGVHRDLVHALELVLHRVLDGEDLLGRVVQVLQRGVQRRALAAAGRPGDQEDPVRAGQGVGERGVPGVRPAPGPRRPSSAEDRSRIRITTLSPWTVGTVETRRSTFFLRDRSKSMCPSCGRKRSAMSSPAMTLMREVTASRRCRGGGATGCSRPSMRYFTLQLLLEGLDVDVATPRPAPRRAAAGSRG